MKKLKNQNQEIKIYKNNIKDESQNILSFSFFYFTKNKKYTFEKMDKKAKRDWESALLERMITISKESWVYWQGLSKENGIEMIFANELNFSPSNDYIFSKDEKVIVFRFNSERGRIIGVKKKDCPIFYVIGLDTDFSAYRH